MNEKESIKDRIPFFQAIFATGMLSWMGWLSMSHVETDRTQDVVLERLRQIEGDNMEVRRELAEIPGSTMDRWHRSEEEIYQQAVEKRIKRLEMFHEPYMWYR